MKVLPEQKELVLRLKKVFVDKSLSLNKLLAMIPENNQKISKSTCQRLFYKDNSEDFNYDYNTLIILSDLLLDEEDDTTRLDFKKAIIETLQKQIDDLHQQLIYEKLHYHEKLEKERDQFKARLDFLKKQVELKDKRMDILFDSVTSLMSKCDNCQFHKPNI